MAYRKPKKEWAYIPAEAHIRDEYSRMADSLDMKISTFMKRLLPIAKENLVRISGPVEQEIDSA